MRLLLLLTAVIGTAVSLPDWQYVVDGENGDDENSGHGVAKALQTISRCVELASVEGGDCLVRSGRYQEVVYLDGFKGRPRALRILGYHNPQESHYEVPTWDGSVEIKPTQWQLDQDTKICSAQINQDIFALFHNDDLLTAARWPNALWSEKTVFNNSFWRPTQVGSDRGLVVDEELSASGLDMTGAMAVLNIGSWESFAAKVDSHGVGNDRFSYNDTFGDIKFKVKNNQYYLEGSLALLDQPGEWVYQPDTQTLHVIPPMSAGTCEELNLRGRTNDYGLVISNSENVTVANFTFFSSNLKAQGHGSLRQIELDSIDFKFPSSSHRMLSSASLPLPTRMEADTDGIVKNCTFLGAEGPALVLTGDKHVISNNMFSYNDWAVVGNIGTVMSKCHECEFRRNSFHHNGAAHGLRYTGRLDKIELNHFEGQCSGKIQNDGASIQISPSAQHRVTVQYNWVHDSPKKGIRFDGDGVGHGCGREAYLGFNVGWSIRGNSELAPKGDNHSVVHNTAFDTDNDCSLCVFTHLGDAPMNQNSEVLSNAATVMAGGGGLVQENYEGKDLTSHLVDVANFDFRPVAGGPLNLPDGEYMGAYGSDSEQSSYWIPGRQSYKATFPIPADGATLAKGRAISDSLICQLGFQTTFNHFYLGLDREAVGAADMDSEEFQYSSGPEENIFQLGIGLTIQDGMEYYWRVDSQRDGHVFKGDVWMFTT